MRSPEHPEMENQAFTGGWKPADTHESCNITSHIFEWKAKFLNFKW